MAAARPSRADRLRRHREELQLAIAEGLSLPAARSRLFERRMADFEQRRARRDEARRPITSRSPDQRPQQWWQRD